MISALCGTPEELYLLIPPVGGGSPRGDAMGSRYEGFHAPVVRSMSLHLYLRKVSEVADILLALLARWLVGHRGTGPWTAGWYKVFLSAEGQSPRSSCKRCPPRHLPLANII